MRTLREYSAALRARTPAWARRAGIFLVLVLLAPAVLYLAGLILVVAWPMLPLLGFMSGSWVGTKLPAQQSPGRPGAAALRSVGASHSFHHAA